MIFLKSAILANMGVLIPVILGALLIVAAVAVIAVFAAKKSKQRGKDGEEGNAGNVDEILRFTGDKTTLFYKKSYLANPKKSFKLLVVVPPTHAAFLITDGTMSQELGQGNHTVVMVEKDFLKSNVLISTLDVIYISKTARVPVAWGTPQDRRVKYIDPKLGFQIDVGCYGTLEVCVADASKFYLRVVATDENFSTADFAKHIRTYVVDVISKALMNLIRGDRIDLSYTDFDVNVQYIQQPLLENLKKMISEDYGLDVFNFIIENVNVTEENEKKINDWLKKQRARADEINDYRADRAFNEEKETDEEAAERRRLKFRVETAKDKQIVTAMDREEDDYQTKKRYREEDRQWDRRNQMLDREERRQDKLLDHNDRQEDRKADLTGKAFYYDAVKSAGWPKTGTDKQSSQQPPHPPTPYFCSKCGNSYNKQDLYCPFCGNPTPTNNNTVVCPACHKDVSVKNKYCPFCGKEIRK